MIEIWKKINDIPYAISSFGNFKSLKRKKVYSDGRIFNYPEKIVKSHINKERHNYHYVFANGKSYRVHVLVAKYFLGNKPSAEYQVNHKDRNKSNNHVDNLEWVTPKENMKHARLNGFDSSKSARKLSESLIKNVYIEAWSGLYKQSDIAKKYNIEQSHVSAIKRGVKNSSITNKVELQATWSEKK
jgi:HNH endonuclease/NUMOD4 motif